MTVWFGYEQPENAHPERPWWKLVKVLGAPNRWYHPSGHYYSEPWSGREFLERNLDEELAESDAKHPISAPDPRCGQVWAWEKGSQLLINVIENSDKWKTSMGDFRKPSVSVFDSADPLWPNNET